MDDAQRRHLDGNLSQFTKQLDIVGILPILQEKSLLQDHHVEQVNALTTTSEKAHRIIRIVKTRGPQAYDTFYDCLSESGQPYLALLLEPKLSFPRGKQQNGEARMMTASPTGSGSSSSLSSLSTSAISAVPEDPEVEPPSYQAICYNQSFYRGYEVENVKLTSGLLKDLKVECVDSAPAHFNENDIYRNFSKPKGLALIFNNRKFDRRTGLPERIGTDIDCQNINLLLSQLGYQVKVKTNNTAGDMMAAVARFALKSEHRTCHSAVVVVLSHGAKGEIYGTDGEVVDVERFVSILNAVNCPNLKGKPKLFFIQACRGERYDPGDAADVGARGDGCYQARIVGSEGVDSVEGGSFSVETVQRLANLDQADAIEMRNKIPTDADIFIAYATIPGFVSWRNSVRGSWFIQAVCQVFAANAANEDLLSLMTKVNQKVASSFESSTGHKQIPDPSFRLTKKFFFFPGYFQ